MENTYRKIQQAKEFLKKQGYYTCNLWQVEDVRIKYECTEDEAHEVLSKAFNNESTHNSIWFSIIHSAEEMGLKESTKDDDYIF